MNVRARLSIIAGVICSALVIASVAWAAAKTTITMQGPDQVFGKIFSPSAKCWAAVRSRSIRRGKALLVQSRR
ncbi:MAG: hypothetical protein ACTHQQ_20985 [Solirubrobacteraceae bacterium]